MINLSLEIEIVFSTPRLYKFEYRNLEFLKFVITRYDLK